MSDEQQQQLSYEDETQKVIAWLNTIVDVKDSGSEMAILCLARLARLTVAEKQLEDSTRTIVEAVKEVETLSQRLTNVDATLEKTLQPLKESGPDKLDLKFRGIVVRRNGIPVPDDRWIVFLASDNLLLPLLIQYRNSCQTAGADQLQLRSLELLIGRVNSWRRQHPDLCKIADVAPGEIPELNQTV
jgi:hypothetical protein